MGEGGLDVLPADPSLIGPTFPTIGSASGRDARVYVAAGPGTPEVRVVDTATDTVVATIPLSAGGAYGIDLCGGGLFAYVSDDSSTVAVVDLVQLQEVATVDVGSSPKQLKILEQPRRVLASFTARVVFTQLGPMLDGPLRIVEDADPTCVGAESVLWVSVPTGAR